MATYTDNYRLTKPTYAEQADIGVINSNMNIIDDIMHSSQVSLAPAYDSTQTYAEGDRVMYELLMYKCISPTTGVWDASKWERTTASESGGGGSAELDILGEASGAVASFADGASAGLAKCIAEIVPKQAGTGTPSPDNVRAISGSTSVTVTVSDGETSTTKTTPLGQTVYGGQLNVLTGELTIDKGMVTFDGSEQWQSMASVGYPIAYRLDDNWGAKNVSVGTANGFSNRYEYSLISLPEQGYRFANNNADTLYVYDINFSNDLAGFKASLSSINMQMCYELATPQTVQLTPQEVNSLLGQNNISADTGDIDIVYVKASAPIQPNPTGTPTATLSKLGIEGTIYGIEGSGGGNVYGAFIDMNRVITTLTGSGSGDDFEDYTAIEDCAVIGTIRGNPGAVQIDGVTVAYTSDASETIGVCVYARRGQTVNYRMNSSSTLTVYGLTFGTQNIFTPQIYSTEERCVGVWIDNKPLYCKTWDLQTTVTLPSGGYTLPNDIQTDLQDAEIIVSGFAIRSTSNNATIPLTVYNANGVKNCLYVDSWGDVSKFTFYYTKTTDTAGSGSYNTLGVPMEHIEDDVETVIGTYNGNTLYHKRIKLTSPTSGNYTHNLGIDKLVELGGTYGNGNAINSVPASSQAFGWIVRVGDVTANGLSITIGNDVTSYVSPLIIDLKYTKSSS